ncbi:unnamed protein product [Mycena citricolor]|uniref:Uncharacterized protein n=1 Tax=Mycena citricolor TaxID=2018698 RepID=A0AAD2HV36_9AGAR|nr:unnamed protein product [Mycena citricolor]
MVASKSPKAAKVAPRYTERVMGAMSQIQRETHKHAIRTASIHARVQKMAQERKEKLGPHWKTFVTKAIGVLTEEGILEKDHGAYALSLSGKKIIATARRALDLPSNSQDMTIEQEVDLWKQVLRTPIATPTRKRLRNSRVPAGDDSDDELVELPSSPIKGRKRARTSSAAASHRPVREPTREPPSPLTELEESMENVLVPTPATASARPRQSRSFIDQLSKQPTPAPTEMELHDDITDEPAYIELPASADNYSATPVESLKEELAKAESAVVALSRELRDLREQRTTLDSELARTRKRADANAAEKVMLEAQLAADVPRTDEADLLAQIAHLEGEKGQLQQTIATKDVRISRLEERNESLAQDAVELNAKLAVLRDAAEALKPQMDALDSALAERISIQTVLEAQLAAAKKEAEDMRLKVGVFETSTRLLRTEIESKAAQLSEREAELGGELTAKAGAMSALESRNAELAASLNEARSKMIEAEAARSCLADRFSEAELRNSSFQATIDELRLAEGRAVASIEQLSAESVKQLGIRDETVAALKSELLTAQEATRVQAAQAEETLTALTWQLAHTQASHAALESTLAVTSEKSRSELEAASAKSADVSAKLEEAVKRLGEVETRLHIAGRKHTSEIADKDVILTTLNDTLVSARADVQDMVQKLAQADRDRGQLHADVVQIKGDLQAEMANTRDIAAELESERAKRAQAETSLNEVRELREADVATIGALQDKFARLKDAQMELWVQFELARPSGQPVLPPASSSTL